VRAGLTARLAMGKIKVLFLASDPFKTHALGLDEEIRAITAQIRSAEYRDTLELVSAWAVRPGDLQQLLLQHQPHVVHFSGHGTQGHPTGGPSSSGPAPVRNLVPADGGQEARLILMGEGGQPQPVDQGALVDLFDVLRDNIRLVVLNACYTRPQAEAIARVVDCCIGTNAAIGDKAAIAFAAAFYRALGFGRDVQTAYRLGKNELKLQGIPEETTLELLAREGVDASRLVLIAPPPASIPGAAGPAAKPPGERAGVQDRRALMRDLNGLAPSDLATLVTAIPGAAPHVSRHGTVPEQVSELVQWAESTNGPGLAAVEEAFKELRNP
jgi:hypothetical protein